MIYYPVIISPRRRVPSDVIRCQTDFFEIRDRLDRRTRADRGRVPATRHEARGEHRVNIAGRGRGRLAGQSRDRSTDVLLLAARRRRHRALRRDARRAAAVATTATAASSGGARGRSDRRPIPRRPSSPVRVQLAVVRRVRLSRSTKLPGPRISLPSRFGITSGRALGRLLSGSESTAPGAFRSLSLASFISRTEKSGARKFYPDNLAYYSTGTVKPVAVAERAPSICRTYPGLSRSVVPW